MLYTGWNIFSTELKTAHIEPVLRNGDPKFFSNYGAISILPWLSKIFECLLYNRIYDFALKFNIIVDGQFGF